MRYFDFTFAMCTFTKCLKGIILKIAALKWY